MEKREELKTCHVELCKKKKKKKKQMGRGGRREGGESAFKLHAQKYKSTFHSAHKVLIQFQRYFSFSS
jgi:hypothetical protein